MSIQTALRSAMSGLRATQQQAATVSHNIANATTPGFVRKDLGLTAQITAGTGQGVAVTGTLRTVDELLIRDARYETSRYRGEETRAEALSNYTDVLGQPQDERSFANALQDLDLAFQRLYGMADDEAARADVVDKAGALADRLNDAAETAATVQAQARDGLVASVDVVNTALAQVGDLNATIATQQAKGADVTDLMDQRDLLLDQVSEEIGIRTYTRSNGMVVVMTRNGQTLLDGTLPAGSQPLTLVGNTLTAGGVALSDDPEQSIQSGRIMGYVTVANQDMPRVMEQLDAIAGALITGFQDAEADPTAAGLFVLDAGPTTSTAARITINPAVEAETWRVQSGVQATTALPVGEQTQIAKYIDVFQTAIGFSTSGLPASATLEDAANAAVATQHGYRTGSESEMELRKISADTLTSARINRDGVNIDDEMQKLLLVEQSYSASAQVIQAASRMIDTLIQIAS